MDHSPVLTPKRSFTIPAIISLNVVIFIMWSAGESAEPQFMYENFLVSWSALAEGRWWVLLTSVFSHSMIWHLLLNMLVLNSFGTLMELVIGRLSFIKFYLVAGIVSSMSHALVSAYIIGDPDIPALGASGAISGVILIFSFMFPKEKILLFGIIPVPALMGALAFIGLDVWGLIEQAKGAGLPIGHGAHLGGAFAGILYYFLFIRPHLSRRGHFV